jgi:predicted anti-sigma-YlaC factor YlaD
MKSCKHILFLLNTKQREQWTTEEQNLLEEHLPQCPSCREHQGWMELTESVVQQWEIPEISSKFSMRVLAATEDIPQKQSWSALWVDWFREKLVVTMALSAVLLIAGLSLPTQQQPSRKMVKKSFSLIHGPSLRVDEVSMASRLLGIEVE